MNKTLITKDSKAIALCIIAIFTALFLLPINIAYEPVKIDFPFEVEDVEKDVYKRQWQRAPSHFLVPGAWWCCRK